MKFFVNFTGETHDELPPLLPLPSLPPGEFPALVLPLPLVRLTHLSFLPMRVHTVEYFLLTTPTLVHFFPTFALAGVALTIVVNTSDTMTAARRNRTSRKYHGRETLELHDGKHFMARGDRVEITEVWVDTDTRA